MNYRPLQTQYRHQQTTFFILYSQLSNHQPFKHFVIISSYNQIELMSFQNNFSFPYNKPPLIYHNFSEYCNAYSLQLLPQLMYQNEELRINNRELAQKLKATEEQNQQIRLENDTLKHRTTSITTRAKRKYSKRRSWLQKKFVCPSSQCSHKYSSMIALNLHIRKHHLIED